MSELIIASSGILLWALSTLASPPLLAGAQALLVRLLGWVPLRKAASFKGSWTVAWHVDSTSYKPVEIHPDVHVRQFGSRLFATLPGRPIEWHVFGTVDAGRYVTGTWKDRSAGGYHGSFQLTVNPADRNMSGLWIGFSRNGTIKHGEFNWTRNGPP